MPPQPVIVRASGDVGGVEQSKTQHFGASALGLAKSSTQPTGSAACAGHDNGKSHTMRSASSVMVRTEMAGRCGVIANGRWRRLTNAVRMPADFAPMQSKA